ncbi:ParB/RepB/Spo0J family partition protein [Polaromonas naphthalenivorans]|uniref:ParB-like partition proteins n=1 Tax=Polaromonas naphthalenivorans (strain CJ2) TaxID=365044 RepID=A1VVR9_POLNA|nr:ParB/RepB/Spo0J family partition protein [Polaromonas naphthalenivorans]ABM39747.1 parB-like partition proteins [Polaromonas naphthalenivorans CJ2]
MTKRKFDMSARAVGFMESADKSSDTRWAKAEQIVSAKPSGLPPSAVTVLEKGRGLSSTVEMLALDVLSVDITKVRDNPRNARKLYDPAVVNQRATSIRLDGQMTPAPACLDWENPGSYILIGGHYRKKALLQNGATHIQIKLLPAKNNFDLYRLSYAENDERQSGTPLDDALSWQELQEAGEVGTQDEIAALVGKPRTTINKTLALLNLSPGILSVLKETPDKFTLTAGYELSLMTSGFSETELIAIAQKVAAGDFSTRDLTRLREARKTKTPRKQKEISRQHKIVMNGTHRGTIKDWDSGKVVMEVMLPDPAERERLVSELRERFNLSNDSPE